MNKKDSSKKIVSFLKKIHKKSSGIVGEKYLRQIAKLIAEELNVDYVMIGLCDLPISEEGFFNSLSFFGHGKQLKNLSYKLSGTPCIKVLEEGIKIYINNVQKEFPKDLALQKMKINSYISVPLQNVQEENIGLLTVMNEDEIEDDEFVADILNILSVNIESVIEKSEEKKKLAQQENNFHRILECIGEGVVLTDLEDRISFVNSKVCQITGYSREELIGKVAFEILLEDEEKKNFKTKIENRIKGISEIYELRIKKKDNTYIWVEIYGSPYFDESGKLIGTIGSLTEITEKIETKRLTDALYQVSEKANRVTDLNEFYETIHSILGNLIKVKNFYIAVLNRETNLINYPYFIDEKDDKPEPVSLEGGLTELIVKTGKSFLINKDDFKMLKAEGKINIVGTIAESWIGVPLKLGEETFGILSLQSYEPELIYTKRDLDILSFVAQNISDVIAHKKDEELKRKKEEDYNFLFKNSPIGIASTNLNGEIINANEAFCALLNYSFKELKKKTIKDITHKDDIDENFDLRKEILNSEKQSFQQQKRYLTKDGKIVHTLLVTFLVYDSENQPKNFTGFIVDISEIIKVKSRNEAILDSIPDMVFLCDKDGKFLDYKANSNELFIQPEYFLGKNITEVGFPKINENIFMENLKLVFKEKASRKFEYSLPLNNQVKHFEARMSLGGVNEVTTIVRDISEARLSRQINEHRNRILELIATDLPLDEILISICEMVENISTNDVKSSVIVLEEDRETVGICSSSSLPKEYTQKLIGLKIGPRVGSCGTAMFMKKTVIVKDIENDPLWADYREIAKEFNLRACWSKPIFSSRDRVIGSFAMYYAKVNEPQQVDLEIIVIATKLAEIAIDKWQSKLALNKERRLLKVTLKSIGDGVITLDIFGKIILINEVAENMTGCLQKDAVGEYFLNILNFTDSNSRILCETHFRDMINLQTDINFEKDLKIKTNDGNEVLTSISCSPIKEKDENIVGAVLVFRDITERQKIENEIQRMSKLESIGLLAGGIAHDFNNMLTGVTGNISLAKIFMEGANPRSVEKLEEAEKASIKAKQLTQQLLTFSKGGAPIKKIGSLGQTINESVQFALRGANISSEIVISKDLWSVEYDDGQIDQVLNNLVINASQSMPNGGMIKVSCENVQITSEDSLPIKDGNYVLIKISDSGKGIPQEVQSKIFEPYFTTKKEGHGLGLATTYSIILKHEGFINFETKEGKGTTFFIYLPSLDKFKDAVVSPSRKSETSKDNDILANKTILVMDDDNLVREVIGNLFEMLGLEVFLAEDGEEAVEIYKNAFEENKTIDLVVTDLTVPGGMGGKDLIIELLKIDPKIKAVIISGYYNDPVMAHFEDFGFKGVIQKPFEMSELIDEVKRVLSCEDD
ncbi:MAG: PAS domain S-box protein [Calditrichaeota bacterium]|nr:MAG: PAS domain S-box protein [Calditrichota bacterium]